MSEDRITTNPPNISSPTPVVAGNDATRSYTTPNGVSVDLRVQPGGKPGGRKRCKNRKNRKKPTITKATLARTGHRVGKSKKNSATAATSSGSASKSRTGSGKQPRLKKAQKREKLRRRSEKENIERKKWLENWLDSENKRKEEQAFDGLVGLMEGFGICAGDKVQEKEMVEGGQEGIAMDMDGLEMQMATLEVMNGDDEGGL